MANWQDSEYREKQRKAKAIEEYKEKQRKAHLGRVSPIKGKTYEEYYGVIRAKEIKQASKKSHEGRKYPAHSILVRQLWQDPEYVSKQMVARNVCPNKAENFLIGLFQDILPNEYKFVGDGKFKECIIAGKVPDFINVNGQKKIIELFGEPFHKPEEEQQRIDLFAQYGYQTLVIWYSELKKSDLIRRIIQFNEKGKLLCLQE